MNCTQESGVARCSHRDCEGRAVVKGEAYHPRYGTRGVNACLQHSGDIAVTGYVRGGKQSTDTDSNGGDSA